MIKNRGPMRAVEPAERVSYIVYMLTFANEVPCHNRRNHCDSKHQHDLSHRCPLAGLVSHETKRHGATACAGKRVSIGSLTNGRVFPAQW